MIFKRFRQKQHPKHLRFRVESCVNTILEVNQWLGEGKIKPEIVQQFERLKESLPYVTDENVDESDIDQIEEATNRLLAEIRLVYEGGEVPPLYEGEKH
jgi:hypothetical protein